ncbi:hypothetical protein NL676_033818 [Syzygium grande]|nr:hypothetical protein NL676_033818 [Syzygium grande]
MQGLCSDDAVRLDLAAPAAAASSPSASASAAASSLSIDAAESAETRIQRLISEHPVIIFSRSACCMCHVMRKLLASIGVNPTVIELDDDEIAAIPPPDAPGAAPPLPAVFIGGSCVGGLESLVALHLSGHLVPKLAEVGVL